MLMEFDHDARIVVLATGGRSLPKTGSDGFGYELARTLGHGYVETTPALAPLVLEGDRHARLAGVTHDVALTLRVNGAIATRIDRLDALDALWCQRSGCVEHVSPLASGATGGTRR